LVLLDPNWENSMLLRRLARTLAVLSAVAVLASCGALSPAPTVEPSEAGASAADFSVTLAHAFGSTTLTEVPDRVATWGWGSTEAALALGVVPVAMAEQTYGADADGVLPWTREAVAALGADLPTILAAGEAPPYEQLIAAKPDVILAVFSGITAPEYELLSAIAPTVAYVGAAWTTPWRDVISTVGATLDRVAEADAVLAGLDAELAASAAAHPELAGRSVAAVWDVAGTFYVYRSADARVEFLFGLGLVNAPAVDDLASGDSGFLYTLSYEELDKLDSDLLVSYHDTPAEAAAFLAAGHTQAIPAVRAGAVAQVVGTEQIAAVSPPTALSLTWGLDDLVASLAAAAGPAGPAFP
jgi:iron complex transport system substrate-binding protein